MNTQMVIDYSADVEEQGSSSVLTADSFDEGFAENHKRTECPRVFSNLREHTSTSGNDSESYCMSVKHAWPRSAGRPSRVPRYGKFKMMKFSKHVRVRLMGSYQKQPSMRMMNQWRDAMNHRLSKGNIGGLVNVDRFEKTLSLILEGNGRDLLKELRSFEKLEPFRLEEVSAKVKYPVKFALRPGLTMTNDDPYIILRMKMGNNKAVVQSLMREHIMLKKEVQKLRSRMMLPSVSQPGLFSHLDMLKE